MWFLELWFWHLVFPCVRQIRVSAVGFAFACIYVCVDTSVQICVPAIGSTEIWWHKNKSIVFCMLSVIIRWRSLLLWDLTKILLLYTLLGRRVHRFCWFSVLHIVMVTCVFCQTWGGLIKTKKYDIIDETTNFDQILANKASFCFVHKLHTEQMANNGQQKKQKLVAKISSTLLCQSNSIVD